MKQVVLITGANGMLAKELSKQLEDEYTVRFLTREKKRSNEYVWNIKSNYIDPEALKGVHTIIHLAGASIVTNRWTNKRKQLILSSRIDSANLILKELSKQNIHIDTFISASAIGYYGTNTTDAVFDENSPKGNDFLSDVCYEWEKSAEAFQLAGIANRIAIVRTGIILAKNEGALKKMLTPIKYGLGSGLGTGKQYMPWIHIQDLVGIYKLILDNHTISGTFNAVSPQTITNIELTKTIARILNKPVFLPNIPGFLIRIIFGEMAVILLNGNKISSKKILDAGFKFKFENSKNALNNLINET